MTGLIVWLCLPVAATLGAGVWLTLRPGAIRPGWLKGGLLANLALFGLAVGAVLLLGVQEVMAAAPAADGPRDISLGMGLALLGIGLPTGLAAIAAAIALGPIGSAAMAVIAEKPELFGRTLIYMGLAEGVAIYGLVLSILMLDKL
jgi:V/A-type H+-transporting ATPase subunit K